MSLAEDLRELLIGCHDDPLLFARRVLRQEPRPWQRELLEEIRARLEAGDVHIEVLVRACYGAGKTWLVAVLTLWWMATRPEARGVTTAPKWAQVENLIWAEINRLHAGSLLAALELGRCQKTFIEFGPAWIATGAAADKPETLEGAHSPTAAIRVVDEAKIVPPSVFAATEGLLAAPESLDLWISTPGLRTGDFYMRDAHGAGSVIRRVVTVDQLVAEGGPVAEAMAAWRDKRAQKPPIGWGVDSPLFRSRAMAEYIEEGAGALYPAAWVERAMAHEWTVNGAPVAGEDVAGSVDGDENVVALVHGPDAEGRYQAHVADAWTEQDTMLSKGRALAHLRAAAATKVRVDVIGLGKGLFDALRMDFPGCDEYRASEGASDSEQFLNRKAEDAWFMRGLLEAGLLRLPADPVVRSQFLAMKWKTTAEGKIRVTDPNDSPDRHDAIVIALSWFSRPSLALTASNCYVVHGRDHIDFDGGPYIGPDEWGTL